MFEKPLKFISGGLFSTESEWLHRRRVIDSYEIIIVVRGCVHIAEGETRYCVGENELLLLSPGITHYGTEPTNEKLSFYWFHFITDEDGPFKTGARHISLRGTDNIMILAKQLLHYANTPEYPRECADYLVSLIAIEMLAVETEEGRGGVTAHRIKEWIRINCDRRLTLSDISKEFGYNSDYLTRLFGRTFGVGIKKYIMAAKMSKAKQLILNGGYSLREAAMAVGMEDYNLFQKTFKYHEGVAPGKFRQTYFNTHMNNK